MLTSNICIDYRELALAKIHQDFVHLVSSEVSNWPASVAHTILT